MTRVGAARRSAKQVAFLGLAWGLLATIAALAPIGIAAFAVEEAIRIATSPKDKL